jgi:trehalose utilization protein
MPDDIRVLIWDEMTAPASVHPEGICATIGEGLSREPGIKVKLARIDDPEQGLSEQALSETDVLAWWGHLKHKQVEDAHAERVIRHVTERGMGFMPIHSAHMSKPFTRILGCDGDLGGWREDGKPEIIYTLEPTHPIAQGLPERWVLDEEEMYCERFHIPPPDDLVFLSTFAQGEVFRSGCCWKRGAGRIFYFRPGHETHRTFHDERVRRVLANAVRWCAGRD